MAVDIATTVFEIAVSEEPGRISRHRRLARGEFLSFFAQRPGSVVVLEACGSAHHWGRQLQRLGHEVVLLPPHQVRPYVTRNKTDRADAKGILEAYRNADIRPVPVKSMPQHVLKSVDNNGGPRGRCHRLAPARADSIMARGRAPQPHEAEDTFAVRFLFGRARAPVTATALGRWEGN